MALAAVRGLLRGSPFFLLALTAALAAPPQPAGSKRIALHERDGGRVEIGEVAFAPRGDGAVVFTVTLDASRFVDHFLSMREFKCLPGQGEVLCHVPYPHARPGIVRADDLAWLEHALLFMFKKPGEFGARLSNGIYWRLRASEQGWVGEPQAVDLNLIGAPPARTDVAPYRPALRDDIAPGARWFNRLTIE